MHLYHSVITWVTPEGNLYSPGHRSDWPAGLSHLHLPELCSNPKNTRRFNRRTQDTDTHTHTNKKNPPPLTFLMTSICSSLHSGLFFLALTKNSMTFCSSWSVASEGTNRKGREKTQHSAFYHHVCKVWLRPSLRCFLSAGELQTYSEPGDHLWTVVLMKSELRTHLVHTNLSVTPSGDLFLSVSCQLKPAAVSVPCVDNFC